MIERLNSENILLLTGISFCGKSQVARNVTRTISESNTDYRVTSDIGEAERFLYGAESGLCILEDPFGHTVESTHSEKWHRVRDLVQNVSPDKKLIITSRKAVIRTVSGASQPKEWILGGVEWVDLTAMDREFLNRIWTELCSLKDIQSDIQTQIQTFLDQAPLEELLQPGQLKHLASLEKEKLSKRTTEELCHFARVDAKDLATDLQKDKKKRNLYVTLGLTCNTILGIAVNELAYILGPERETASLETRQKINIWRGKPDKKEFTFPSYKVAHSLEGILQNFIEEWLDQGYLITQNDEIYFAHPLYLEVSDYLIGNANSFVRKAMLDRLWNTISCLSPVNAFWGVKKMATLAFLLPDLTPELINIAFSIMGRTIFPKVRDGCLHFLLKKYDLMNGKRRMEINENIRQYTTPDILWEEDEPFTQDGYSSIWNRPFVGKPSISSTDIVANRGKVPTKQLWKLALDFGRAETPLNLDVISRILSSEEVFIRQKIANDYLRRYPELPDPNLAARIFKDDSPAVRIEGLKGFFQGIGGYNKNQIEFIRRLVNEIFCDPISCLRANNLLSTFGIDYGHENLKWEKIPKKSKAVVWDIWAEVFILFLEYSPGGIQIYNSGRFSSTLDTAALYLSPERALNVSDAYFTYLEDRIDSEEFDTHELSVLDFLLRSTKKNKEIRKEVFLRILSSPDTGFLLYSLSWAISSWKELLPDEREVVVRLIESDRVDLRWIKAVCITGYKCPQEIQQAIFGDSDFLSQDAGILVNKIEKGLLRDSMTVWSGHPQPLWWYGFHHNGEIWRNIIREVLLSNQPAGYDIALREFVSTGVNGFSGKWGDWQADWETICRTSNDKKGLIDRLIIETVSSACVIETTSKFWESLIEACRDTEDFEYLTHQTQENIEGLANMNGHEYFWKILNHKGFVINEILPLIPGQIILVNSFSNLLRLFRDGDHVNFDEIRKCLDQIESSIAKHPNRIGAVVEWKSWLLRDFDMDAEVRNRLDLVDVSFGQAVKKKIKALRKVDDYDLPNWTGLYKRKESGED